MTTDRLLPCPHCGEAEHLYPSYRNMGAGKPYAIDCLGCGADYVPRDGMDVIAMWNRRSPAPSASMGRVTDAMVDAALRGWYGDTYDPRTLSPPLVEYHREKSRAALERAAALDSPPDHGGGEGWVLVPRKPTAAMKEEVMRNGGAQAVAYALAAWPDMLAAASLPTQESEDGR